MTVGPMTPNSSSCRKRHARWTELKVALANARPTLFKKKISLAPIVDGGKPCKACLTFVRECKRNESPSRATKNDHRVSRLPFYTTPRSRSRAYARARMHTHAHTHTHAYRAIAVTTMALSRLPA